MSLTETNLAAPDCRLIPTQLCHRTRRTSPMNDIERDCCSASRHLLTDGPTYHSLSYMCEHRRSLASYPITVQPKEQSTKHIVTSSNHYLPSPTIPRRRRQAVRARRQLTKFPDRECVSLGARGEFVNDRRWVSPFVEGEIIRRPQ